MNSIVLSIIVMTGMGVAFAFILAIAYNKLKVQEDPVVEQLTEILPGANCGGCGFAGCYSLAEKIAKGEVGVNACPVGGAETTQAIAKIMGLDHCDTDRKIAVVHCGVSCAQRTEKSIYDGAKTCLAADMVKKAGMECSYGCVGYGDCIKACPFNAISETECNSSSGKASVPVVDKNKCRSCGKCVSACPRNIISLEVLKNNGILAVACSSHDKGPVVRKICKVGCIGCKICEKKGEGVFTVTDFLSSVDASKEVKPSVIEECIKKCPAKCIVKIS